MIAKNKKRLQITLDKKTIKVINYYKKDLPGTTTSNIVEAIINKFYEKNESIGYSQIWRYENDK